MAAAMLLIFGARAPTASQKVKPRPSNSCNRQTLNNSTPTIKELDLQNKTQSGLLGLHLFAMR